MYEILVKGGFSAAHALRDYQGNCARVHGHNWSVTVYVRAGELNEIGIAADFRELKQRLNKLLERFDHTDLNAHPAFAGQNPTSETLAKYLYAEYVKLLQDLPVKLARVQVSEAAGTGAAYWE